MRILHIITRLVRGGAQENTLLSVIGQQQAGHEVRLLCGPTLGPEGSLVPDALAAGVDYAEIPDLIRAVNPLRDLRAYRQLRRAIRDYRPEVVHTHSSKAGVFGRLAAWHERVPFITHTIHGLPFHPYQSRAKNLLYVLAEKLAARNCHRIISVCDTMSRKAVEAGIAAPEKFCTVYSGMETDIFLNPPQPREFYRAQFGIAPGEIIIGKVARLFELKGHEELFAAFARIKDDFPQARLMLVGDGAWRGRLAERARALGIAERIIWTGLLHPQEVPQALHAMDILAHCSLREGLARVLPQALLCGRAVISYDIDGAGEVVIDGQTGWLLPPQDIDALERALREAIGDPTEAAARAARGRELWRARFAHRLMCRQLLDIYAKGLDR